MKFGTSIMYLAIILAIVFILKTINGFVIETTVHLRKSREISPTETTANVRNNRKVFTMDTHMQSQPSVAHCARCCTFTQSKNTNETSFDSLAKLPVTISNDAQMKRPISNLRGYKMQNGIKNKFNSTTSYAMQSATVSPTVQIMYMRHQPITTYEKPYIAAPIQVTPPTTNQGARPTGNLRGTNAVHNAFIKFM